MFAPVWALLLIVPVAMVVVGVRFELYADENGMAGGVTCLTIAASLLFLLSSILHALRLDGFVDWPYTLVMVPSYAVFVLCPLAVLASRYAGCVQIRTTVCSMVLCQRDAVWLCCVGC